MKFNIKFSILCLVALLSVALGQICADYTEFDTCVADNCYCGWCNMTVSAGCIHFDYYNSCAGVLTKGTCDNGDKITVVLLIIGIPLGVLLLFCCVMVIRGKSTKKTGIV
jgi:hypothetical protein